MPAGISFPNPGTADLSVVMVANVDAQGAVGKVISYREGLFISQECADGSRIVPLVEVVLTPDQVHFYRNEIVAQLQGPGTGMDEIPLRAFLAAADFYFQTATSRRFAGAVFGAISSSLTSMLQGKVSWAAGTAGTIEASASPAHVTAETHLDGAPAPAPLQLNRPDLQSLEVRLQTALAGGGLDPLWGDVLNVVKDLLA